MKCLKIVLTVVSSLFLYVQLYAGAGTTSGIILRESIGARGLAMGEAFVGVASGTETIFWNPAGLAAKEEPELSAMYFKEIVDLGLMSIQYAQPLAGQGGIGLAIESFSAGDMELNYLDGTSKSVKAQNDYIINLAYGKKLGAGFSAGTNVKYLNSTLAEAETASAVAVDISGLYQVAAVPGLALGINLQNIGTGLKYIDETDPLPFIIKAGAAYQKEIKNNILTISGDIHKPRELSARFNVGAEYLYNHIIALRAGYKFNYDMDSFTAGFGVKINRYSLDYAFAPKGALGDNHRLSLGIQF
ncbi:MAG: PorV/PorQ family protein [Elusimicrobia bacterium]|nr:PorV/PorQ family protein [Elusimicrobiota bacterium]